MSSGSAKLCLQVEEPENRRLEPGKGGAGDEGFQWDSLPAALGHPLRVDCLVPHECEDLPPFVMKES